MPRTVDEVDVTTFGAGDFRQFLAGFQNATVDLTGFFDDLTAPSQGGGVGAAGGADKALTDWLKFGTQVRKFIFSPSGTATGKIRYEGTAILLGYSFTGNITNAVGFTSNMRVTGSVSRYTW